jgi:hypothetical protein
MISITHGRFAEIVRVAAPPALVVTSTGVLLRFPPAQNSFYPECPIYRLLHLLCPGCGATRALAALLHGHFSEAIYLNGLTTVLLPIAVIGGVRWYCRYVRREAGHWPQLSSAAIYATLAAAMIFAVVRNLPLGQLR